MYCRHALGRGRIAWLAAGLVWTLVTSGPTVAAQAPPKPKPPSTASKSVKPKRQPLPAPAPPTPVKVKTWQEIDKEVAARFAPSFYQGMAGTGRFDDITNFDFDGDWIGDNNWEHAGDKKYGAIGYDLIPIFDTLWKYPGTGRNETFGEANDYGDRAINVLTSLKEVVVRTVSLGLLGSALRGSAGAPNKARPPWGWFDMTDRDRPLGEWFLDPAGTISRHLSAPTEWELTYLHHPYFGVYRDGGTNAPAASPTTKAASTQTTRRSATHP